MIRHFCLNGGSDFAILTLSYPYNFTEFLRKLWQDWKGGRRHLDEKREDLGPLLVEQFRQQMNNLSAAIQLLTPVVREKAGPQYDPYLAILHQSLYRLIRMVGNLEYLELPEGELPLREGTLDLAGLCRELGEQVSPLTALAGIRFSYEEEIGSLLTHGDGAQRRRLLLNLIANAQTSLIVGSYLYADDESGYTVAAALLDALLAGGKAPAGLPRAQALYLPRSCQGFFRGPGDELGTAWAALGITRRNLVWTAGQAASLHLDA